MIRVLLMQVVIAFLAVGESKGQNYTIERDFDSSTGDKFTIPKEMCEAITSGDKCSRFGAVGSSSQQSRPCQCQCPFVRPVFFDEHGNGSRRCMDEAPFRRQEGCGIFVLNQEMNSPLPVFQENNYAERLIYTPNGADCKLNVEASRYLLCNGTWAPISTTANSRFQIIKQSGNFLILVSQVPNSPNLDGRIIRIAVTCNPQGSPTGFSKACVLFKLHGQFKCPAVIKPKTTSTTTDTEKVVTTTIPIVTTKTNEPTTTNAVAAKGKPQQEDSIVPLAFGLGALGIIILVVLCIVLVVLMNRRRDRSGIRKPLRRHSAQEEISIAKQSSTAQVGLNMYGDNTIKHSESRESGTLYLNTKEKEAKEEEEKYKKSMGETNEWYEGDSAYNTIRTSDSPSTSEGGGFDHRHYSIPRKAGNQIQPAEEVIEAEFRMSAEIPPVYDVPDNNSVNSSADLNKTPDHLYDAPEGNDHDEIVTSTPEPVSTSPPLRLTVKEKPDQSYVPIVVLDNKTQKSADYDSYDTPERVIDLNHQYLV